MLMRRREKLAQSAEPIGWKIGFNVPEIQEKLGLDTRWPATSATMA